MVAWQWYIQISTTHFLFFKVKELKDRHPEKSPWEMPTMNISWSRCKVTFWPWCFPRCASLFNCASFSTLTTHSLDELCRLSEMVGCNDLKRHAFKAAFIKNFIKGFATFSFAFCSSFSLSCKSEQFTQRHSLKIHHTSSVIKHTTLWE